MTENIIYYFWASYHRKILDRLLGQNKHYYQGLVLDIGGRNRGKFKKPKDKVEKWIVADIKTRHQPDIILDVCNMNKIKDGAVDVVNATELFEHIENPQKGLEECYRILKKDGLMILSTPFLYPIHPDPHDFQRWTERKWKRELKEIGFEIQKFVIMGRYFTVWADLEKALVKSLPNILRWTCYLVYPLYDLLVKIDNLSCIKKHPYLGKFHGGYFIIAKKQ